MRLLEIFILDLVACAKLPLGEYTVANDQLIYIDDECLEEMQNPRLMVERCNDTFSLNGEVYPALFNAYNLRVSQPAESNIRTAKHSWDYHGNQLAVKFMYKAKFKSMNYMVREGKDEMCVKFTKRGEELVPPYLRWFQCIRIKPGEEGVLYILEDGKKRCDKHQFNTECKCPNQKATARLDGPRVLKVNFKRKSTITGYHVSVFDMESRREIDTNDVTPLDATQKSVELVRYIPEVLANLTVKVSFWCNDYINETNLDRQCNHIDIPIRVATTPVHPEDTDIGRDDVIHVNVVMKVVIVIVVFLVVVISAAITGFIFKRKMQCSGERTSNSLRTNYHPVSTGYIQLRRCAILYQPDLPSSGTSLTSIVLDLERKIEAKGVQVCSYPPVNLKKSQDAIENWCLTAERIANEYDDIIFVTSQDFNLLWSTYISNDELQKSEHQRLLVARYRQENIPCSVLNILHSQLDNSYSIKPNIYIVAITCTDTLNHLRIFLGKASFLLPHAKLYCLGDGINLNCSGHTINNKLKVSNGMALAEPF